MRNLTKYLLTAATVAALSIAPAAAAEFGLYGSYWDTDEADSTAGGGVNLAFGLSPRVDLEFRAAFYEKLEDDAFDAIFEDENQVFQDGSLELIPVEAGLKFELAPPTAGFRPYIGAGGSYFIIEHDNDAVEVDDEAGFYAQLGTQIGDPGGVDFFVEALYRSTEATLTVDPDEAEEPEDIDLRDPVALSLDGVTVNAGLVWGF